jgi:hypothetical protein
MDNQGFELMVIRGPLTGSRFTVTGSGIRLGRSSSCEISVPDPALSRNQCLFECRDGAVWVTDLASANGTTVNGEELGVASVRLEPGDTVQAGDSEIVVRESVCEVVEAPVAPVAGEEVDLGFAHDRESVVNDDGEEPPRPPARHFRLFLWLALVLVLGGSALAILMVPVDGGAASGIAARPLAPAKLWSVSYEKVEANLKGICRYAIEVDSEGVMKAQLDDVPDNDRHVVKSVKLSDKAKAELDRIFSSSSFYKLEKDYSGAARPGELTRYGMRVARGAAVFSCTVENSQEPDAFKEVRLALETFSQNELGIWAIRYSGEKLAEMSREAWQSADAKWEERDVNYGNLAAALKLYNEAVSCLETVNPKPADYADLLTKREMVQSELDRRYGDQRFEADRAINLGDWEKAKAALRVLCEMIPDDSDARHAEASAKLMDVESRIKKGGNK